MTVEIFQEKLSDIEAKQLNPLVLAFIGDAVYEVFVRNHLLLKNRNLKVNDLHKYVVEFVKAKAQSNIMKFIEHELTEDEVYIYKRGRNCKSATVPKNANVTDYRIATGFEAVIGYLHLTGREDRLNYIYSMIIELSEV